jgi:hypothetical protein
VDLRNAAIMAGLLLVVFGSGLWYVNKKTGRPWRDMILPLAAGVVSTVAFLLLSFVFYGNTAVERFAFRSVALGVALSLWWLFFAPRR